MFNNISWQGYWIAMALLTTGYYLVIYLIYFRSAFAACVHRSLNKNYKGVQCFDEPNFEQKESQTSLIQENPEFKLPPKDSEEHVVYACMDEVTAYLEQAKASKCTKEELRCAFQRILKKYPELKSSVYKESLSHVIVTQCENLCSIHLQAEDVVSTWSRQGE